MMAVMEDTNGTNGFEDLGSRGLSRNTVVKTTESSSCKNVSTFEDPVSKNLLYLFFLEFHDMV